MRASITTLTDVGAFTSRELVAGEEGAAGRRVIGATAAEWNIFQRDANRRRVRPRRFAPKTRARGAEPVIVLSHRIVADRVRQATARSSGARSQSTGRRRA